MIDELYHYGTPRHSGRYPYGSGENPYQRQGMGSLRARVKELQDGGMSEKQIADYLGMSTTVLRQRKTLERDEELNQRHFRIMNLKENGYKNTKIAEMLGITEGTVRNEIKKGDKIKESKLRSVANDLDKLVSEKKYIDVGTGAEFALNCTKTKLQAAISLLQDEKGYEYHNIRVPQLGTDKETTVVVLCPPGTEKKFLYNHLDQIHQVDESRRIDINGDSHPGILNPRSVDRKRIMVRYAEDGGAAKDGTIELRRGVDDISLGKAHYAQVRIAVDDKAYMKGMAFYNDNMPPGVDIIYNSNKKRGAPDYEGDGPGEPVFKTLKAGKDNPFGATIKGINDPDELRLCQREYTDKNGKVQQSCINVVNEEGTWNTWSKSLSSQFLSKQPIPLARRQLDVAYKAQKTQLDEILKLTEPTLKRMLLLEFGDNCDAAASELKAAALPRQRSQVIIPVTSLKDNEVYAPNFKNGEHVCLIRYPHAGTFEIPELVVNNGNSEGKKVLGKAPDAIGINVNVAQRLSGADFDGDSVIVLPSDNTKIKTSRPLDELQNFDPNKYRLPEDKKPNGEYVYPTVKNKTKQQLMGSVSNLITDMTLKGAPNEDIVRAVKHSMVVIDSEKHRLDYKASERENGIAALKAKWQGGSRSGASTIVSRASAEASDFERKQFYPKAAENGRGGIDPETGKKIYEYTGKTYEKHKKILDENGKVVGYEPTGKTEYKRTKTNKMDMTDDAYTLTSDGRGGYPMETIYADHANRMKALGNQARKEALAVKPREYTASAAKTYSSEVDSINTKLIVAQKNAPRERAAQLLGNSKMKAEISANPDIKYDKDKMKKLRGQALASARTAVGAKKERIKFTDKEWEAIQAGAFRPSKLEKILNNSDKDEIKQRAMPKADRKIKPATLATIKAMANSDYSQAEIAEMLGVSTSTVNKALND